MTIREARYVSPEQEGCKGEVCLALRQLGNIGRVTDPQVPPIGSVVNRRILPSHTNDIATCFLCAVSSLKYSPQSRIPASYVTLTSYDIS